MYRVTGDGKPRAGNVVLAQVRQRVLKFAPPFGIGARDSLRPQAGLPHAEEPDPIQTHLDQTIQFGVRNIIQRGGAAQFLGQFRQPDASVDLIERRTTRACHRFSHLGSTVTQAADAGRGRVGNTTNH